MRMDRKAFYRELLEAYQKELPYYIIQPYEGMRENIGRQKGIGIGKEGKEDLLILYPDELYQEYMDGSDLASIIQGSVFLIRAYLDQFHPMADGGKHFEQFKESIIYRLMNYEKNQEMLKTMPHIRILDLAVIFCLVSHLDHDEMDLFLVTRENMDHWNVTQEQLEACARENTRRILPPVLQKAGSMVPQSQKNLDLYFITNQSQSYGSAVMLYPGFLQSVAEGLGDDLYILPLSVHLCAVVPAGESTEKDLITAVRRLNKDQTLKREFYLSSNIYRYAKKEDEIYMVEGE